jgi:hypothetical protein
MTGRRFVGGDSLCKCSAFWFTLPLSPCCQSFAVSCGVDYLVGKLARHRPGVLGMLVCIELYLDTSVNYKC